MGMVDFLVLMVGKSVSMFVVSRNASRTVEAVEVHPIGQLGVNSGRYRCEIEQ